MKPALVLRMAWRDWRAGELKLILAALLVAVGTVTAIASFVDRLQQALLSESSTFLAADRVIRGSDPIPDEFVRQAHEAGLETAGVIAFASMVFAPNDDSALVSVKAVGAGYPLRGVLRTALEPFGDSEVAQGIPPRGEVWLDSRLFPSLGLTLGDSVWVGVEELKVTRVVAQEPDRGGGMFELGPRLLMNIDDVPATEVIQPGSRIGYRLLLAGADAPLESLRQSLPLDPVFEWQSIRESSPSIGEALARAESFLLLGGLLAVLLAGVAVALAARRYTLRHFDHVGVMKTLGATPNSITSGFVGILLSVGLTAIAIGLGLGFALQEGVYQMLQEMLRAELPPPGASPFVLGTVTGLICLLSFAVPPFIHLRQIAPMRVLRKDVVDGGPSQLVAYAAAFAGVLVLLIWYTGDLTLTLWTLLGALSSMFLFGGFAVLLLRGSRNLGMQARSGWRLGLAGLQRRYKTNVAQIMIFGLAIMLLLILVLLRTALLEEWQQQLPDDAPNHFVLNITPDQVSPLESLLAEHATRQGGVYPMMRGRALSVNGTDAKEWESEHGDRSVPGPGIDDERNITWSDSAPKDNRILDGAWWPEGDARSLISLEDEYARRSGLSVGDRIVFDVAGRTIETEVMSIRTVDWDSLQPNFYVIFSRAALADVPSTFMTSFHLPMERKPFLNDLLRQFPTLTVIEVDALIEQVKSIVDRVTQAIELVLALVLGSGVLVLVASVQASKDERVREHALLRALGATRSLITVSLAVEFATLGFFAGVVAAVGAELTVAVLQSQVFGLGFSLHPLVWLLGPLVGACLIVVVGMLGTLTVVRTPPVVVLRSLD
ncbi:MAG: FtsX-like permease family protein [Pseudomonadaceae bacterium]|nr:FtsX-like permease family protein [Pseudomonadaceae bacterium]